MRRNFRRRVGCAQPTGKVAYRPSGSGNGTGRWWTASSSPYALWFWVILAVTPLRAAEPWLRLPATPSLPAADAVGPARINGIDLWFATFGPQHKDPVILLHGGLANSNYWGDLVPALAGTHQVVVIDSRGHGRSSRNATPISYEQMADDVVALMDRLRIHRAALVGWSDGAIVGLELAIHHADRLSGVFAFAANSDPSGVKDVRASPVFSAFIARAASEYKHLNPAPDGFAAFDADIEKMWAREPNYSDATLRGIHARVWIVDGDHDEAIKRENTDHMASLIPAARELILPGVSHFAFLQDPVMFNFAVEHFLQGK
jgi:pimeloyl-ACP methyl ester carboxylesterase